VAALSLLLMALPRAYAAYLEARPAASSSLGTQLAAAAPWQRAAQPDAAWRPETPGADHRIDATFTREGDSVDLFIGYYAKQSHERKLISNANRIADPEGWTRAQWGRATVAIDGERVPAISAQIVEHGRRRLVLFWYWVDGRFESRAIVVKLLQAKADLIDRLPAAAAVALSTEIGTDGLSGAERRLADFAAHLTGLRATLAAAR
jgi:EpsI family protein